MNQEYTSEENFNKYFFDVRQQNGPKHGQIMVSYSAMADFVKGPEKKQMISLVCKPDKAIAASQVMRKLLHATEIDSVRVPRMIIEDLLSGMSIDKVLKKPYRYKIEVFFYTWPECVPNDPHWTSISLMHMNDFFKAKEENESQLCQQEN